MVCGVSNYRRTRRTSSSRNESIGDRFVIVGRYRRDSKPFVWSVIMFPINHVVIITKENHTFDNYFGTFPGATGVALPHAADPHPDQGHGHDAWLAHSGAGGVTGTAKTQYQAADIPSYWAFAQQYTLCDNYFTDGAGKSEPNPLFLIAADSPLIDNSSSSRRYQPQPPFDIPSLPQTLAAAGHTWRNYADLNSSYFEHITAL